MRLVLYTRGADDVILNFEVFALISWEPSPHFSLDFRRNGSFGVDFRVRGVGRKCAQERRQLAITFTARRTYLAESAQIRV